VLLPFATETVKGVPARRARAAPVASILDHAISTTFGEAICTIVHVHCYSVVAHETPIGTKMGASNSVPAADDADNVMPPVEPMAVEAEQGELLANEEEAAPQAAEEDLDKEQDTEEVILSYRQEANESHSCCYKCCSVICCCCPCCLDLPRRWPRTFGILMGIVVPLFSLIGLSLLFGFGVASLEAPGEVDANNAIIATSGAVKLQEELLATITEELPTICADVFWLEQSVDLSFQECLTTNATNATNPLGDGSIGGDVFGNSTINNSTNSTPECKEPPSLEGAVIEETIQNVFVGQLAQCSFQENFTAPERNTTDLNISLPEELTINHTELMAHMANCGQEALRVVGEYQFEDIIDPDLRSSSVSFNWVRCTAPDPNATDSVGDAIGGAMADFLNPFLNTSQYLPHVQEEAVMAAWKQSQEELYCQYLEEALLASGPNITFDEFASARLYALEQSIDDADGFSICDVNYFAGAWFW